MTETAPVTTPPIRSDLEPIAGIQSIEQSGVPGGETPASQARVRHDQAIERIAGLLGLHHQGSDYFDPSPHALMINFRVDDLDAMLAHLRQRGVEIVKVFDPEPNGRFAHVMGPDGIKLELWEPVENDPYDV